METATKAKAPFGQIKQKNVSKASADKSKKWAEGIAQQQATISKPVNVQTIPIEQIRLDPLNARKLILTTDDIKKGPKLPPNVSFDDIAQKEFQALIKESLGNDPLKEEKTREYLLLAQLAASIGEPGKLINPVTVILKGMEFHLIAGHRRTLAHMILSAKNITATILTEHLSPLEHSLVQWKENNDREDLTLSDEVDNINRIVMEWEKENNSQISVRKLMPLLNIKRTNAAWLLSVAKATSADLQLKQAVQNNVIVSLGVAYHIANMCASPAKQELLNDLISGEKLSYKETMARIQNPDISVRSPDTKNENTPNTNYGLKINKKTDTERLSKILRILIKSPEFKGHQVELETLNINSKHGILAAWEKICQLLAK